MAQTPEAGGRVNPVEVRRLRQAHALEGAPKREITARQILAADFLFATGHDESAVRQVVSTSPSSWHRFVARFREHHGIPEGVGMSEFVDASHGVSHAMLAEHARESELSPDRSRQVRVATDRRGWSFVRSLVLADIRAELASHHIVGPDVGDVWADAAYLQWRESQELAAAEDRRAERQREELRSVG